MFKTLSPFTTLSGLFHSPGTGTFTPRQLFAALQGAWLEPVVGNIWQENTGVTPTTTGGQTIGKIADRSGGGHDATQATAGNRPLLGRRYNLLTNSVFSGAVAGSPGTAPTVWTFVLSTGSISSYSNNTLTLSATSARLVLGQTISYEANTIYRMTFVLGNNPGVSAANIFAWNQAVSGSSESFKANGATASVSTYVPVAGDVLEYYLSIGPTSGSSTIRLGVGCSGNVTATVVISNPSLVVAAYAAYPYQRITTATDYDYGQYPAAVHDTTDSLVVSLPAINVRRNLLTYSEQFDNAAWVKQGLGVGSAPIVTPNYGLAPDGTATADRVQFALNGGSTSSDVASLYQVNTDTAQKSFSVYLRSLSGTPVVLLVETGGSGNRTPVTITSTWQRFTYSPPAGANTAVGIRLRGTQGSSDSADILVWGAQLELGSVATDYQKITDWTSEAYASSGSVYFATPVGMSALHNQSMGATYTLPALSTDIYSWIVVPQRLSTVLENRLARYMERKAGIAGPDYFEQEDYGPELVTNGGFDTDSWWIKDAGCTISNGVMNFSSAVNGAGFYKPGIVTPGKVYLFTFSVPSLTAGGLRVYYGAAQLSPAITQSGTYSFILPIASGTNIGALASGTTTLTVDNFSVRELKDGMTGQLFADDGTELLLRA